ncbi:MAG: chorismate--pyruvate lyase [Oscillospiraceae bacterium]|nr:chorismate--pyruvate lyase [Oscillospiraceae bacterium]
MFETKEFVVQSIDGDYANLLRIDIEDGAITPVARFLLPMETDEGSRLRYENFEYNII